MKKLELQKCIVGSVYTNCYFLKNKENGELLIVDPGDAADTIFYERQCQNYPTEDHGT